MSGLTLPSEGIFRHGSFSRNSPCSIQSFSVLATFLAPEYEDIEDVLIVLP